MPTILHFKNAHHSHSHSHSHTYIQSQCGERKGGVSTNSTQKSECDRLNAFASSFIVFSFCLVVRSFIHFPLALHAYLSRLLSRKVIYTHTHQPIQHNAQKLLRQNCFTKSLFVCNLFCSVCCLTCFLSAFACAFSLISKCCCRCRCFAFFFHSSCVVSSRVVSYFAFVLCKYDVKLQYAVYCSCIPFGFSATAAILCRKSATCISFAYT